MVVALYILLSIYMSTIEWLLIFGIFFVLFQDTNDHAPVFANSIYYGNVTETTKPGKQCYIAMRFKPVINSTEIMMSTRYLAYNTLIFKQASILLLKNKPNIHACSIFWTIWAKWNSAEWYSHNENSYEQKNCLKHVCPENRYWVWCRIRPWRLSFTNYSQ